MGIRIGERLVPRPARGARAGVVVLLVLALVACAVPWRGPPDRAAETLRVVSYNIRHGRGADDRVDLERTAEVLGDLAPDLVGLQEVDEGVERSGGVRQAERLGEILGMAHAFGSFFEYQGGEYGMAILSRHPIRRVEALRLTEGNEPRVALVAEVELPGGSRIAVVNVHFDWVEDDGFRYTQAREVAAALDTIGTPVILLGDFNDAPESRTLELFRSRMIEAEKPADARRTFPAGLPERELDYVFAAPPDAGRFASVRVIEEEGASDHRPVLAVFERSEEGGG